MNYWWVNHKQTYKEEIEGGYIWSPKVNKNGSKNQFYINMTRAKTNDVIFSFADTKIKQIGIIEKEFFNTKKPKSFNQKFDWNENGYKINVKWFKLNVPLKPKDHIDLIAPLLKEKYSPIQKNGNGIQTCYLAHITNDLANLLLELISENNKIDKFISKSFKINSREDKEEEKIKEDLSISNTTKLQLINARYGQGKFKQNLMAIEENGCRITKVVNPKFLIASHIKPWAVSNNKERLDGNNGLLLSPHIDKLFDKGFISFYNNGKMKYKKEVKQILNLWKINLNNNYGPFNPKQKEYLKYHREIIFEQKEKLR